MNKLLFIISLVVCCVYAQKPMESIEKTLIVFVHGTMDIGAGTAVRNCVNGSANGANTGTYGSHSLTQWSRLKKH